MANAYIWGKRLVGYILDAIGVTKSKNSRSHRMASITEFVMAIRCLKSWLDLHAPFEHPHRPNKVSVKAETI